MQRAQCLIHNCSQLKPLIVHQVERSFCLNISKPSIIPLKTRQYALYSLNSNSWSGSVPPLEHGERNIVIKKIFMTEKNRRVYSTLWFIYAFSASSGRLTIVSKIIKTQPAARLPYTAWQCLHRYRFLNQLPSNLEHSLMSYLPWNRLHAFMAQATLLVLGGLNVPPSMHNCAQNLFSNKVKWSPERGT